MDFDKASTHCFLNGQYLMWENAHLHPINQGLHYGSCVFEGERAYNGKIFKITQHSERLMASATSLDFDIPYSVQELNDIKQTVVRKTGLTDCYIRAFAWVGDNQVGLMTKDSNVDIGVFAFPWHLIFPMILKDCGFVWLIGVAPTPELPPMRQRQRDCI